jgi:hypothetical protein
LTCNEIKRLFNTFITPSDTRPRTSAALVDPQTPTPTPRTHQPLPPPTSHPDMNITKSGCPY